MNAQHRAGTLLTTAVCALCLTTVPATADAAGTPEAARQARSYPSDASPSGGNGLLGVEERLGKMTIEQARKEIARLAKLFGVPASGR
ncbi:hypothetical protein [Streptomyces sp. I05A-00742]|uniref:hypothetical protein n=1 Tax=Streptomyces sp. I05A-00742 TaxID=2732853 RepID=UPI001489C61D|nr:hypothetical protein [Streptomyces sp. I05A-00742]